MMNRLIGISCGILFTLALYSVLQGNIAGVVGFGIGASLLFIIDKE